MAKSKAQKRKEFRSSFLAEFRGSPMAKMVDLEVDGIRAPSLSKNSMTPGNGVYEFELQRRQCSTRKDWWLSTDILSRVLYSFGFPDKPITKKMVARLKRWLLNFKRIGSKYGDYSWLDDNKINELIKQNLGLIDKEIELERNSSGGSVLDELSIWGCGGHYVYTSEFPEGKVYVG